MQHCHDMVHDDFAMLMRIQLLKEGGNFAAVSPTPIPTPDSVVFGTPEILREGDPRPSSTTAAATGFGELRIGIERILSQKLIPLGADLARATASHARRACDRGRAQAHRAAQPDGAPRRQLGSVADADLAATGLRAWPSAAAGGRLGNAPTGCPSAIFNLTSSRRRCCRAVSRSATCPSVCGWSAPSVAMIWCRARTGPTRPSLRS